MVACLSGQGDRRAALSNIPINSPAYMCKHPQVQPSVLTVCSNTLILYALLLLVLQHSAHSSHMLTTSSSFTRSTSISGEPGSWYRRRQDGLMGSPLQTDRVHRRQRELKSLGSEKLQCNSYNLERRTKVISWRELDAWKQARKSSFSILSECKGTVCLLCVSGMQVE